MLTVFKIDRNSKDLQDINLLHQEAFPDNERVSLDDILDDKSKTGEIYSYYDKDEFCGYACILNEADISHIIYFAVRKELRNQGYGSKILKTIHNQKKEKRIIVDIEKENEKAYNNAQRIKRRNFYYSNDYQPTEIFYEWNQDYYTILSHGGTITNQEFEIFWEHIYKQHPTFRKY